MLGDYQKDFEVSMKFGLACEGITDHITIENILCGFFKEKDLEGEITFLQPLLDETQTKQNGWGGWQLLTNYLTTSRFRDDVLNNQYIIIQIDTDISEEVGLEVKITNEEGIDLPCEQIVQDVTTRLIEIIGTGDPAFLDKYHDRIVFSICVHSIECWIFSLHNIRIMSTPKTKNCDSAMINLLKTKRAYKNLKIEKNYNVYEQLSHPFLKVQNILSTSAKCPSLRVFIENLEAIRQQIT